MQLPEMPKIIESLDPDESANTLLGRCRQWIQAGRAGKGGGKSANNHNKKDNDNATLLQIDRNQQKNRPKSKAKAAPQPAATQKQLSAAIANAAKQGAEAAVLAFGGDARNMAARNPGAGDPKGGGAKSGPENMKCPTCHGVHI